MKEPVGPKFVQYLDPVVQALKQIGGSGRPAEVVEKVAQIKNVSETEQQETLPSGVLRFANQIAFARQYLVWGGYIDASQRGVWSLTEKGLTAPHITDADALQLFREQHKLHSSTKRPNGNGDEDEDGDESLEPSEAYKEK